MNEPLRISKHAKLRLEERFNEDIDEDFMNALDDITYYKILSINGNGAEVRQIDWFGFHIQYIVNKGVVITFTPANNQHTKHGEIYQRMKIKALAYDELQQKQQSLNDSAKNPSKSQKEINKKLREENDELRIKIKDNNKEHTKKILAQKEKYCTKIKNINANRYNDYFVRILDITNKGYLKRARLPKQLA
jgi:hypothetical protein